MKVLVENETVRTNVELFKKVLQWHLRNRLSKQAFSAYINCMTGILEESPDKSSLRGHQWKEVVLQVDPEGVVIEEVGKEKGFSLKELDPSAYHIMYETLKVLNQLFSAFENPEEIAKLEIVALAQIKDIIHEAWHQVDRLEAEQLLLKEKVGTYLFRKDEYTTLLERELRFKMKQSIQCITLTYFDPGDKIAERVIVRMDYNKWLFYDDDPSLEGFSYPSIYALLDTLQTHLKFPLINP